MKNILGRIFGGNSPNNIPESLDDQKGNYCIALTNIDTFKVFWECMPHLQSSESIRNIVNVLLEQKKLEIDKEICARDRN